MPSKKKKYNARFPAGRIKKIMQMDDDVGKIAHAVPVVISRSVELFVNNLLQQTASITKERNAKTVSVSHAKQCILKDQKFAFLKDLVKDIDDISPIDDKKANNDMAIPTTSSDLVTLSTILIETGKKRCREEPQSESSIIKHEIPVKRRSSELPPISVSSSSNISSRNSTLSEKYKCQDMFQESDKNSTLSVFCSSPRDLIIDEGCSSVS